MITPGNSGTVSVFSRYLLRLALCAVLLPLVACASSPYEEGKSPADVPAHVDVIHLRDVYMSEGGEESNGDPKRDLAPSKNDQEVTAIVKTNITSQLTNLGYSIVEDPQARADITMSFFIGYIPERWPLIGRSVSVMGRVYDAKNTPVFDIRAHRQNSTGLIGAAIGPSRDEMVADATREAVVNVVQEMRKGTKDNKPVKAAATSQQPTPTAEMVSK